MSLNYIWYRTIKVVRNGQQTGTPVTLQFAYNGKSNDRPAYFVVLENKQQERVCAEENECANRFLHSLGGILHQSKFPVCLVDSANPDLTSLLIPVESVPVASFALMKDSWARLMFIQRENHPESTGTPTIIRFSENCNSDNKRLLVITLEGDALGTDHEGNERADRFLQHLGQILQQQTFPCHIIPKSRHLPLRLLIPVAAA